MFSIDEPTGDRTQEKIVMFYKGMQTIKIPEIGSH